MGTLTTYSAVYPVSGCLRRLWFEAASDTEALAFAARCGAGLEGPATAPAGSMEPESVDEKTARRLLGGISRTTLWRELALGDLDRVPGTRRVLVTLSSIRQWTARKGLPKS
jgi:hypothetical protein